MRISSTAVLRICGAALSVALASLPLLAADKDPAPAPAPVPAPLVAARKVFISNAGVNGIGFSILKIAGDADEPYNQLYTAMKSWGRYEIVGAPADADLVFEVRFDTVLLGLTILDGKTHFILWTIAERVETAVRAKTWEKNIGQGIANLMRDLTAVAGQPDAGGGTKQ